MADGLHAQLPEGNNTIDTLRQPLWRLWLQSNNNLEDIYWSDLAGDCTGYYTPVDRSVLYEMYCNKSESQDGYIYVVDPNGDGYGNRSDYLLLTNYSVTNYPWWKKAIASRTNNPLWSHVYKDPSFPEALYITCSYTLWDPATNLTLGVVSVDVTSEKLSKSLQTITISQNSQIWVMQKDGDLVGSSDLNERSYTDPGHINGVSKAYESNIPLIKESTKKALKMKLNDTSHFTYKHAGETIDAYYYILDEFGLDFVLMVAYPRSDFFGIVKTAERILLGVFTGALVISAIIGIGVMYLITSPLTTLGRQMDEISKGTFETSGKIQTSRSTKLYEINALQQDFDRMVNALRSFGRFVPVDIVRYLLRNNAEAGVTMQQKTLTVMFSDIKNFTRKVEEMSPAQLSIILGDYLNAMCSVIVESLGTVDKFIGDAIMALWNVPTPIEGHVHLACTAALESLKNLEQLNAKWTAIGLPMVEVRIGIHTGKALVGNLGSQERLAYTAVGDNINLGARLEALNKKYGEVYKQVKDQFLCRYLDVVIVCGRTTHTHIYELVAYQKDATERQKELCSAQEEAMNLFLEKKFDESLRIFEFLAGEIPDDLSIKLIMERAMQARGMEKLPSNWRGYLVLDEK